MELKRLTLLLGLLSACAAELQSPIPTTTYANGPDRARTLVVMLPGAGDRIGAFDDHGFVAAMRDSGMAVDILEVDAHMGYYKTRTLLERMEHDVLAPHRDQYEQIWLVGISLGGFGALLTALTYPEDINGLVLMAPYLGRRKTHAKISKAGGLARWHPPATVDMDNGWDIELWRLLKRVCEARGAGKPELYLMYGEDDFGARAHDLLADALPASRVRRIPGGHAWTTWTTLWRDFMRERVIVTSPASGGADPRSPA